MDTDTTHESTAIKGLGRLRHRFFLNYSAVIVLIFESAEQAMTAWQIVHARLQGLLPNGFASVTDAGGRVCLGGLQHLSDPPEVLRISCTSHDLEMVKQMLGEWGADVKAIDSVAHSIDFGDVFRFAVPVEAQ